MNGIKESLIEREYSSEEVSNMEDFYNKVEEGEGPAEVKLSFTQKVLNIFKTILNFITIPFKWIGKLFGRKDEFGTTVDNE